MTTIIHRLALAVALAAFGITSLGALSAPIAVAAPHTGSAGKTKAERPRVEGKLNLNTADAAQLQMLPGVGKVKAERVLDWRKKNGPFKRVKDLRRVKGFGKKTVETLEPYLVLDGPTTLKKG